MSEVIVPERTAVSPAPTVAWTPLGENAILVMSACDAMPAKVPVAVDGNPANRAHTMVLSWRRAQADAAAATGFLCLAPAPATDKAGSGALLIGRPGRPLRLILAAKPLPLQAFLSELADEAGQAFPSIVDGLLEVLLTGTPNPRRLRAVAMLLQTVARPGGFVEVMGTLEPDGVFLQGWTSHFAAGRTKLLIAHGGLSPANLEAGTFERDDLGEGARGFFGLLEDCRARHPGEIERLYFRSNDGWRALEVYERHVLLEPITVPGHLRDGLQRGTAPQPTADKLRKASQRFDGRDTVCLLEEPVRAGIDDVTIIENTGVLIIGWLFDPERRVNAVTLRSGGQSCAVDRLWTRVQRPDVTAAFLEDPRFGALASRRNSHGFIVFAPKLEPEPGQPLHLAFEIQGTGPAFLPLEPGRGQARRTLERVFGLLDPRSTTASTVVERQIAPALQAAEIAPPRPADTSDVGAFDPEAPFGLVIGLDHRRRELSALFAMLAMDPEVRPLPIVLAAPVESSDRVGSEARRLARFYGLSLRLAMVEGVEDACDAMEAGVRACRFQTVALLSGTAQIRMPGWLGRLERAYRARGGQCVASPTLLFEDDSIRWAGAWLEGEGANRRIANRFVGYPLEAVGNLGPMEVAAGVGECCVLSRAAFVEVGGFARNYFTTTEKGLDLCLKLRMAGAPSLWVPDVEIYAVDDGELASPHVGTLAQLADRTSFDRRWALAISNMKG